MGTAEEPVHEGPLAIVSGRVLDSEGGPLLDGAVLAYEEGPRQGTGLRVIGIARVEDDGGFRLEVSPGPCLLIAFSALEFSLHPDPAASDRGVRIVPSAGEFPGVVELRLPTSVVCDGSVSVLVRDSGGAPIPKAKVAVELPVSSGKSWRIAWTDDKGWARIRGLPAGTRKLLVYGNRRYEPSYATVDLGKGGAAETSITAPLRTGPGTLSVVLRCEDDRGVPLAGATVELTGDEDFDETVVTGTEGEIEVNGLPDHLAESHFAVFPNNPGFRGRCESFQHPFQEWPERVVLRLEAKKERPHREFRPLARRGSGIAPPTPGATVSGSARDAAGAEVSGARVLWARDEGAGFPDEYSPLVHEVATTDAEGRFTARGLAPGPALLKAMWPFGAEMGAMGFPIPAASGVLEAGIHEELDFRFTFSLSDIAEVRCRIVDEQGSPRKGATVTGDRVVGWLGRGGSAGSDSDGIITLRMFPGRNDVHAWETESHEGAHQVVEVQPAGRHAVDLVTPARSGAWSLSLAVSVVDEKGDPVPGAEVLLSTMEGGVGKGRTDEGGRCLFPRLHDGIRREELYVSAYADGFCIGGMGATISAWPEGKPAEARVALERPVKIRVRVVEKGTEGFIPGVKVYIQDRLQRGSRVYGEFDCPDGLLESVRPGPIRLVANAPGYTTVEEELEVRYEGTPLDIRMVLKRLPP